MDDIRNDEISALYDEIATERMTPEQRRKWRSRAPGLGLGAGLGPASGRSGYAVTYELTTNVIGDGAIARDPDRVRYRRDTDVDLTALPSSGYALESWGGDIAGTTQPEPFYCVTSSGGRYARGTAGANIFGASEARTIGVWVYPITLPGHHVILAVGRTGIDAMSLGSKYANTNIAMTVGTVAAQFVWANPAVLAMNEWTLLVGTYNGGATNQASSYTLYRCNGGTVTTFGLAVNNTPAGLDMSANMVTLLAHSGATPGQNVNATIAQAFAYSGVWTLENVTAYYTGGYEDIREFAANPVLYYRMSPGSGQTVVAEAGPNLTFGASAASGTDDPTWHPNTRRGLSTGGPVAYPVGSTSITVLMTADRRIDANLRRQYSVLACDNTDYIDVPNFRTLNAEANQVSAFCWVKGTNNGVTGTHFIQHGRTSGQFSWSLTTYSGSANDAMRILLWLCDDGTAGRLQYRGVGGLGVVLDGLWHHIGVTYNAGTIIFYIDGVQVGAPLSGYPSLKVSTDAIRIPSGLVGSIARPMIFDYAASPEDVAAIHTTTNPVGTPVLDLTTATAGTTTTTWTDGSGNNRHGTSGTSPNRPALDQSPKIYLPPTYALTTGATGSGSVVTDPSSAEVPPNDYVVATPSPAAGNSLASWSGDLTDAIASATPYYGIACRTATQYASGIAGSVLFAGNTARTFGIWVHGSLLSSASGSFFSMQTAAGVRTFGITLNTGATRCGINLSNGSDYVYFMSGHTWRDGGWNLCVLTYDGLGTAKENYHWSLNGAATVTPGVQNGILPTTLGDIQKIVIGNVTSGMTVSFAQAFAYNGAWTDQQIAAYYNGGYRDVRDYMANPVFYYRMQPGTGQTIAAAVGPDLVFGATTDVEANDPEWIPTRFTSVTAAGPTASPWAVAVPMTANKTVTANFAPEYSYLYFDGSDYALSNASWVQTDTAAGGWSVAFRVYAKSNATNQMLLGMTHPANRNFEIYSTGFRYNYYNGTWQATTPVPLVINAWNHILVAATATNPHVVNVYVNGVKSTFNGTGTNAWGTFAPGIGYDPYGANRIVLAGTMMCDLRWWSGTVLDDAQSALEYANTSPYLFPSVTPTWASPFGGFEQTIEPIVGTGTFRLGSAVGADTSDPTFVRGMTTFSGGMPV